MKGRITKVLNMKPLETLGMIEEAAGTKMYDDKRAEAVKEMDKKQRKVDDIDRVRIIWFIIFIYFNISSTIRANELYWKLILSISDFDDGD